MQGAPSLESRESTAAIPKLAEHHLMSPATASMQGLAVLLTYLFAAFAKSLLGTEMHPEGAGGQTGIEREGREVQKKQRFR